MIQPRSLERPERIRNPRSARGATHRRIVKKSRARYAAIVRLSGVLGVLLVVLMSYVVLTSSLTGLSYAVANAKHERETLEEESMRLDDRIAALRSDDRLAALAARLGMREPQSIAVVHLPVEQHVVQSPEHMAVISSLTGFFTPTR
ncbi:MAG TPA: hypothetical protein VMF61_06235 [Candidatus Acidoferrales bacterium]|nr:hypothetical protein [Candidatus Acidoferrales bacterium]